MSEKRILPAFLLCFFLGVFGAHRFYAGKIGTGILQLVTLGGLGIWALIDFIMIVIGSFTDKEGNKITQWT
jgi:TM2 domain-containing membrane protein YozV